MNERRQTVVEYLLDEMESPERARFEAELAADPELAAMVEEMRPVISRLETLPDEAWDAPEPPPLIMPGIAPDTNRPSPADVSSRRQGFGWLRAGLGLAAAVVILAVGVLIGTQLESPDPGGSGTEEQTLAMTSLGEAPTNASGKVILTGSTGDAVTLDVSGLDPTGAGEFYELWLLGADQELVALGSFRVEPDGASTIEVPLPVNPDDYEYFDVSIQPDNGDPGHSGRSVLRGVTKT